MWITRFRKQEPLRRPWDKTLMKRHCIAVALLTIATTLGATELDTRYLQGLGDIRYHEVAAEAVGRSYHVYVRLPEGYSDGDDDYPTLYLLDGGALLPLFASYYRALNFSEEVPDSIIVGISYGSDSFETGNYRSTDYTAPSPEREYYGGAARFQRFLADELMPMIQSAYRSNPERRIVFGQSIGGQFVIFTAMTRPDLFWGHIASNPALHRNVEYFLEPLAGNSRPGTSKLVVAAGTNDDARFVRPRMRWVEHWREHELPLQWTLIELEGHSHMSAPPASFRQGMRWLFR